MQTSENLPSISVSPDFSSGRLQGNYSLPVCCLYKDIEGTISAEFIADQVCILMDRSTLREIIIKLASTSIFGIKYMQAAARTNTPASMAGLSVNG